jgi:hypothetical protein
MPRERPGSLPPERAGQRWIRYSSGIRWPGCRRSYCPVSRIRAVRAGMRRGRGYYMVPALPAAGLPALRVAGSGCISPTEARRSRSVIDIRRAGCTTDNSWSPSMHVMPGKAPHVGHSQRSARISDTDAHPPDYRSFRHPVTLPQACRWSRRGGNRHAAGGRRGAPIMTTAGEAGCPAVALHGSTVLGCPSGGRYRHVPGLGGFDPVGWPAVEWFGGAGGGNAARRP